MDETGSGALVFALQWSRGIEPRITADMNKMQAKEVALQWSRGIEPRITAAFERLIFWHVLLQWSRGIEPRITAHRGDGDACDCEASMEPGH